MTKLLHMLLLTATTLVCCASLALASNGMENIATNVRTMGAGGAYLAVEPAAVAMSGNPAALAFLKSGELYFDVRLFEPVLDYTGLMNATGKREHFAAPNLAYGAPLDDRWAWGLGVVTQASMGYAYKDFDLSLVGAPPGTRDSAGAKFRFLTVTPAVAYKLSPRTSVGVAYNWSSGATDEQSYDIFGATVGHSLSNLGGKGQSVRVGLYHQASCDTTWGAYWRSRSHLEVDGGRLTFGPFNPAAGTVVDGVSVIGGDFPEQYGLGVSHRFDPRWTGLLEWRHLKWAKVKQNVRVQPPVGDPIIFPMNWDDQDVLIAGAEYRPDCSEDTVWRFGTNYAASPVPDNTLSPMFPAITQLHFTAGYERALSDELRLVSAVAYGVPNEQTTTADNTLNGQFGGGQPYSVSVGSWDFGLGLVWKIGDRGEECDEDVAPCDECAEDAQAEPADSEMCDEAPVTDDPANAAKDELRTN